MREQSRPQISVIGCVGAECFGRAAADALAEADVVVGSPRQLAAMQSTPRATIELTAALHAVFDAIDERLQSGSRVAILASGDPGFFGIVRALGARFGPDALTVYPAPSSISLAFARVGMSWDDARVVSAHGRSLDDAVAALIGAPKAAVLTSPDNPPEAVGAALRACGERAMHVAVLSRIGEADEARFDGDLETLARGTFDPLSIVLLWNPALEARDKSVAWGLPEDQFAHRAAMITKAEVRAVALGKLALPTAGVLWDVGAGSGSVGIEAARLAPALRVFAIEHDAASVARVRENAATHGVAVDVVHGRAPDAFADLPDPDRVFVGGGGLDVLDAALKRLVPGGVVVANFALADRAVAAWQRLGNMVQLAVSRGVATGDEHVRLAAENPVFVCWGPS